MYSYGFISFYVAERGLFEACIGGHQETVLEMIDRGANDWNNGLTGACKGNHHDLIRDMIARGATFCYCCGKRRHPEL